ncbi:MAG TPA: HAD family hydrolase [Candidatus Limnocylindrales bacterium]|nr:HAD family hydrolase [Candidatus Limnocylindrales bacterium]
MSGPNVGRPATATPVPATDAPAPATGVATRPSAVLFDWDGTLADSLALFFGANVAVMRELDVPFDEALYRRHYTADWRVAYRRLGVPEERLEEAAERWRRHFDDRVIETRPLPGACEAVERLGAAGIAVGIVTAGDRRIVEPQLEAFGLAGIVSAAVYRDDLEATKPDPTPLLRALELLGLDGQPEKAAYLGDAPDDMRMARAVGCRAIGVRSMLADEADLRAAGAQEVTGSVAAWVAGLLGDDGRRHAGARPNR